LQTKLGNPKIWTARSLRFLGTILSRIYKRTNDLGNATDTLRSWNRLCCSQLEWWDYVHCSKGQLHDCKVSYAKIISQFSLHKHISIPNSNNKQTCYVKSRHNFHSKLSILSWRQQC